MQALQGEIINHPGTSWKRIILESGLYPGPLNVSKPRLQLCSRDLNGAVLTGTITLSGSREPDLTLQVDRRQSSAPARAPA